MPLHQHAISRLSILLALAVATAGCASLPRNPPKLESLTLPPASGGLLAEAGAAVSANAGADESAFLLLDSNADALLWRLALIDHATTSIEMKYFIWENDETGRLLLERLMAAAARGVRVRLLVDDFPIQGSDHRLAMLARTDNFYLRVFNPGRLRRGVIGPAMEMVIYFQELNRRMHNKLMIVDGHWAIVGGRNIGNPYFGLSEKYNFRDLDLLVTGQVLEDLGDAFDEYWNSGPAYPAEAMGGRIRAWYRARMARDHENLVSTDLELLARTPFPIERRDWSGEFGTLPGLMATGAAEYLHDPPIVRGDRGERLLYTIPDLGQRAQDEVLMVTPYLIPPRRLRNSIAGAVERGASVRILTASMAANNHTVAHSHYKKYRRPLLDTGARLFEFHHEPRGPVRALCDTDPVRSRFVALHIKAVIEDRERVYLGSLNLDPRAMEINTENIMVIDSPELAERLAAKIETMLEPGNAWEVVQTEEARIEWRSGPIVETVQPARHPWQRVADFFFRLLPIEGLL